MSIYGTSITNPKKQLEFYKQLSEQLQQENEQLKADYGTQAQIERDMLQQENKILKENAENNDKVVERLKDENEHLRIQISARENVCDRLAGNWNKLKEYLHNVDVVVDYSENYDGHFTNYDELIDKMQELEQGSDK